MKIPTSLPTIALLLLALGVMPAQAFDCSKAASVVEKAICATPQLKAVDDAMSAAYAALRDQLEAGDRKALAMAQGRWVKSREDNCGQSEGVELNRCILSRTEERRRVLKVEPETGPGTGSPLMPVFVQSAGDKFHYENDYTLLKFIKPQSKGEKLFNAEMEKIRKSAKSGRQEAEALYAAYAAVGLAYASPKFLSARIERWETSGGAHGNGWTSGLNIDLTRGVALKAGDLFDTKGLAKLLPDCAKQIMAQKKAKMGAEFNPAEDSMYDEKTVVQHLQSLDFWTFRADRATVIFNPYDVGSYAEGGYECAFPMAQLKQLAKPGAPLPE